MAPTSSCFPHVPATALYGRSMLRPYVCPGDPTPQVVYHEAHEAHEGRTDSICGLCQAAGIADAVPIAAWAALLCRAGDDDSAPAAVIEPATLALMEPDDAAAALARLSPTQRVAQAVAQAAWLADFGYAVTHTEILASWATA